MRTAAPLVELYREGVTARPFRTLGVGDVADRFTGESARIELADLMEMVKVFQARKGVENVPIDWNHQTSPFGGAGPQTPDTSSALGEVVDLFVLDEEDGRGPGLYVVPAYTARGREVVESHQLDEGDRSALWSSPEFVVGREVYGRDGSGVIGTAQLLAVALTVRPAQTTDRLDAVRLNETSEVHMDNQEAEQVEAQAEAPPEQLEMMDGEGEGPSAEELAAENAALREEVAALKAALEEAAMTEGAAVQAASEAASVRARLEAVETQLYGERKGRVIDGLVSSGRVSPAERGNVEKAYDAEQKHGVSLFSDLYASRTEGEAVPLAEVGHGAAPRTPSNPAEARKVAVMAWCEKVGRNYYDAPVRAFNDWEAAGSPGFLAEVK